MASRSRFVRPDTATLTLKNGDTLTVKRRLNSGEKRAMFARLYLAGADGRMRANPLSVGIATVEAYLIDWSLRDDDDRPVVIRDQGPDDLRATLDALDPESFAEIRDAVDAHIAKMDAERTAEKNGPGGANESPAISPSPSVSAGVSNGSVSSILTTMTS